MTKHIGLAALLVVVSIFSLGIGVAPSAAEPATSDAIAYSAEETSFDADYPEAVAEEQHPDEVVSDEPESDTPSDDEPQVPAPAEEDAVHPVAEDAEGEGTEDSAEESTEEATEESTDESGKR